jgi:hypothetical protein
VNHAHLMGVFKGLGRLDAPGSDGAEVLGGCVRTLRGDGGLGFAVGVGGGGGGKRGRGGESARETVGSVPRAAALTPGPSPARGRGESER